MKFKAAWLLSLSHALFVTWHVSARALLKIKCGMGHVASSTGPVTGSQLDPLLCSCPKSNHSARIASSHP